MEGKVGLPIGLAAAIRLRDRPVHAHVEYPDTHHFPICNGSRASPSDSDDANLLPCGCTVRISCAAALAENYADTPALVNDTG